MSEAWQGHYEPVLVALSVAVAVLSSYVALIAVPRLHDRDAGRCRTLLWTLAFGASFGSGIWTMHFIAMLAFSLPVAVRYDASVTAVSLALAMLFSTLGVWPMRQGGRAGRGMLMVSGMVMGVGIAAMHYTGMAAMRFAGTMDYDLATVALSVMLAMAASTAGLAFADRLRSSQVMDDVPLKSVAAALMGLAIASMHYTGMAAVHFAPASAALAVRGLDTGMLVSALTVILVLVQGGLVVVAALDEALIAGRKRMASEARYHQLAELIPDAVGIHRDGCWRYVNPAAVAMFGAASADELVGSPVLDRVHPEDRETVVQRMRMQIEEGKPAPLREERLLRLDGRMFWGEVQARPFDDDGKPSVLVVMRDITDRKQAQTELAHSERRWRSLLESNPAATLVTRVEDGALLFANRAAHALLGMQPAQAQGVLASEVYVHAQDRQRLIECIRRDGGVLGFEAELRRADGRQFWSLISARRLEFDGQDAILSIVLDDDERKRAQQKLEHVQRLESLGVLAGGIAHDFNNLLMAVMGHAALVRRSAPADRQVLRHVQAIEDASSQAADLCRQMLAYAGRASFEIQPLDLNAMIQEMVRLLKVSLHKGVELELELVSELPRIEADRAQIQQVLMNLVINANEAIGERSGRIVIGTGIAGLQDAGEGGIVVYDAEQDAESYVELVVRDDGCGMDARTQARIFEPFFTTKFTGRGLGMSAVLGIVRGHRGSIVLRSAPGKGTEFRIRLPAVPAHAKAELSAAATWTDGKGACALLVDDEAIVREVTGLMLESAGFRVIAAEDGEQAIALFREHAEQIALVLLDITMPRLNGEAAFDAIRRMRPTVPVVLASGYSEQDIEKRFAGRNISGFLHKPFTPEALRAVLAQVFGQPSRS